MKTIERLNDNMSDEKSDDYLSDEKSDENNPYKLITQRIDSMKIKINHKKDLDVVISKTKDMDVVKDVAVRAGVIVYTKENETTYFCLGVDTESGNLTDFGGGVKKGETVVDGALRELKEESLGVFGDIDKADLDDMFIFHSYNMAIIFIHLDINKGRVDKLFKERVKDKFEPEVCDVVWLPTEEFMESIHGRGKKLYIRVRRLLNKVTKTILDL